MQLALLDALPSAELAFDRAKRLELGSGAWVDWTPGWLPGHGALLARVLRAAAWERHRRVMYERMVEVPRLVAACPGDAPRAPLPGHARIERRAPRAAAAEVAAVRARLHELADALGERFGRRLDRIQLAHYRDGQDAVAMHADHVGARRQDSVVAVLSLGAPRRFALRPTRGVAGRPRTFHVGEGDLLVMGGTCQATWEHGVPRMRSAGSRVAVMFREA
ncbi:MAG: alpha-ketoglutarate-dependent dioxygenase AlkB [Myxococcota bacterium]